jgi:hypothetical protein
MKQRKLKDMKKTVLFGMMVAGLMMLGSCGGKQQQSGGGENNTSSQGEFMPLDRTIYGLCGEGTAMNTLELLTDNGDTLVLSIVNAQEAGQVFGGLQTGDRLAVMGKTDDHGLVAKKMINLTTLLGKWTSLDKNFEIVEGGLVNSNVEAESNPWVSWKILNGHLLLNTDTFDIVELGADSLYIENDKGIFVYKRAI